MKSISVVISIVIFNWAFAGTESVTIKNITKPVQHAEGPHWDQNSKVLYYVDTFQATVKRYSPDENRVTGHKLLQRDSVGIIVPVKGTTDRFVIGADRFVYRFDWGGKIKTSRLLRLGSVDETKPKNQFNDGKADAMGRVWIGTLTRESDLSVASHGGSLYRISIDSAGKIERTEMIPNLSIPNGIAWTKDNKIMYLVDSEPKQIYKYDFDLDSGEIHNKSVVFDLNDHADLSGIPDGMTIDTDDNLWIALHGGHHVLRVDPTTGTILKKLKMPATYVTSVCFGGENFETLFVTTSRLKLNATGLTEEPMAGSVFAVTGLGVRGLPAFEPVIKQ